MTLAQRVKTRREALGISQEKLAQQMGIDRNTLWHIEAGKTTQPRLGQMMALAKALGVSIDYLAGLSEQPAPAMPPGDAGV
jgi:transcriptional regulator with XRE-family HTH domain